jgi:hypothetical protein
MTYDWNLQEIVLVEADLHSGTPIQIWTWDGAAWRQRGTAGAPVSPVASVAFDPATRTVLAIAGRCSGSDCLSETWSWDGTSWQKLTPPHEPDFAFSNMTLFPDPISGRLLLLTVSGTTPGRPVPTETWTWDGRDWSRRQLIGQPGAAMNAVTATADGTHGMVLAFDDVARDFNTLRIDAWEWTGTSWKAITVSARSP